MKLDNKPISFDALISSHEEIALKNKNLRANKSKMKEFLLLSITFPLIIYATIALNNDLNQNTSIEPPNIKTQTVFNTINDDFNIIYLYNAPEHALLIRDVFSKKDENINHLLSNKKTIFINIPANMTNYVTNTNTSLYLEQELKALSASGIVTDSHIKDIYYKWLHNLKQSTEKK